MLGGMRALIAALFFSAAVPAWAQQWRNVETPRSAPPAASAPSSKGTGWRNEPNYDPQRQRCQNFARQIQSARDRQAEASITGAQNLAAMNRIQVEEQARQAGCNF